MYVLTWFHSRDVFCLLNVIILCSFLRCCLQKVTKQQQNVAWMFSRGDLFMSFRFVLKQRKTFNVVGI